MEYEVSMLDTADSIMTDLGIDWKRMRFTGRTLNIQLYSKLAAQAVGRKLRQMNFEEITIREFSNGHDSIWLLRADYRYNN